MRARRRTIVREYSYPAALERAYVAQMSRLFMVLYRESRGRLIEAYTQDLAERNRTVLSDSIEPDGSSIRTDVGWIESAIRAIGIQVSGITTETIRVMTGIGENIADFNEKAWKKSIARTLVGVDLFKPNRWLLTLVREWSSENAKLIKSIPEQFLENVARMSSDATRAGTPVKQYAKDLAKRFDLTKARSRLIARTEVAKLNSQVTQQRQQNLGIELYIFRTSADERVRHSHKVMEGKVCRWDDPTVYKDHLEDTVWKSRSAIGGTLHHPGNEFQCRCHSQAVIDFTELLGAA